MAWANSEFAPSVSLPDPAPDRDSTRQRVCPRRGSVDACDVCAGDPCQSVPALTPRGGAAGSGDGGGVARGLARAPRALHALTPRRAAAALVHLREVHGARADLVGLITGGPRGQGSRFGVWGLGLWI